jgi:hypothetical protein
MAHLARIPDGKAADNFSARPPTIPALIDPEILNVPDQPTFSRIRSIMDREATLVSQNNATGLFVLPRQDYPEVAIVPTASPEPEFWSRPIPVPTPGVYAAGRESSREGLFTMAAPALDAATLEAAETNRLAAYPTYSLPGPEPRPMPLGPVYTLPESGPAPVIPAPVDFSTTKRDWEPVTLEPDPIPNSPLGEITPLTPPTRGWEPVNLEPEANLLNLDPLASDNLFANPDLGLLVAPDILADLALLNFPAADESPVAATARTNEGLILPDYFLSRLGEEVDNPATEPISLANHLIKESPEEKTELAVVAEPEVLPPPENLVTSGQADLPWVTLADNRPAAIEPEVPTPSPETLESAVSDTLPLAPVEALELPAFTGEEEVSTLLAEVKPGAVTSQGAGLERERKWDIFPKGKERPVAGLDPLVDFDFSRFDRKKAGESENLAKAEPVKNGLATIRRRGASAPEPDVPPLRN